MTACEIDPSWKEFLLPALRSEMRPAVWPFDGPLDSLVAAHKLVVVETYPAEAYSHIGVSFAAGESKRRAPCRAKNESPIRAWAKRRGVVLDVGASNELARAFGNGADGEDRFDAFVGLAGMLEVLSGHRSSGEPLDDTHITTTEGWILGLDSGLTQGRP